MNREIELSSFKPKAVSIPGEPTKVVPPSDVEVAQQLIRIPSYESEEAIGQWIAGFVQEFGPEGFETKRLPVGVEGRDTILIANTTKPDFIILSHIDTVDPWVVGSKQGQGQYDPFGASIDNGRIYGRGASDQKGSAASILKALTEYKGREDELPKMMIALPSMEEADLQGALALSEHLRELGTIDNDYHPAFILESGSDRQLGWQCRGCVAMEVDFRGVSGHAAVRTPGTKEPVSAFEKGTEALISTKNTIYEASETPLGRTTTNFGSGEYGLLKEDGTILHNRDNRIPDIFRTRAEFRPNGGQFEGEPITGETLAKLLTREAIVRGLSVADIAIGLDVAGWTGDKADTKWIEEIAKGVLNTDDIPVWNAHEHGLGEVAIVHGGASDDGRKKVGAASFGTADSTQFHAVDESVGVSELPPQTEIFSRAMIEFKKNF